MAKAIAAGIFALGIAALFVFLFVPLILRTLGADEKPPLMPIELGLLTAVAGYVGGVIAIGYGVQQANGVQLLGGRLAPTAGESVQSAIGLLYVFVYVAVTGLAVFAWATKGELTPEAILTEVTVAVGLAFAVVTKVVSQP